jgi:hypothetical protein
MFATIQVNSDWITTGPKFLELKLPWINVLPQIGPLLTDEYRLADDRVLAHLNSRLSSRHFRNQLLRMDTSFAEFKTLAEETWHWLSIDSIQEAVTQDGTLLSLPVRDGDFVAEVGWMGHGLQMWLQTIWFLSRTAPDSTVVLDEPDVYMHPDLQRKLFRLTRGRFLPTILVGPLLFCALRRLARMRASDGAAFRSECDIKLSLSATSLADENGPRRPGARKSLNGLRKNLKKLGNGYKGHDN